MSGSRGSTGGDKAAQMARVKDAIGKAGESVDREKLKQWVDDVDRDKLKGWLEDVKTLGAGAASLVEAEGQKLAKRAPGMLDNLSGAARETLDSLTGHDRPAGEGQLDRLKGQVKETFATVVETAESEAQHGPDAAKTERNKRGNASHR